MWTFDTFATILPVWITSLPYTTTLHNIHVTHNLGMLNVWICGNVEATKKTTTQHTISRCLYKSTVHTLCEFTDSRAMLYKKKTQWIVSVNGKWVRMNTTDWENKKMKHFYVYCAMRMYGFYNAAAVQCTRTCELLTEFDFIVWAKQNVEYWPDSVSVCTRCPQFQWFIVCVLHFDRHIYRLDLNDIERLIERFSWIALKYAELAIWFDFSTAIRSIEGIEYK